MRAHSSSERMANATDVGGMVSGYQLTVYIMATYSATGVDLACVYCAHLWHGRIASDHVVHHGT